jgi:hypothetical protein
MLETLVRHIRVEQLHFRDQVVSERDLPIT